jgi:putative hydrolase
MSRPRPRPALNAAVAGLLRELADVQLTKQQRMGYGRAAMAVLELDEPLDALVQPDGTLARIPGVGPSSTRVVLEVLQTGTSATVARALAATVSPADLEARRALRQGFLSRAEVLAALRGRHRGPALADYRGDLQMHSTWSDGRMSLADIVEAGIARGYAYCAVTDHGYGLPVAHGVSMAALARQHRDVDALNARYAGRFRLLKGIEANIRQDGTIDMAADELRQLEIVVAAPHSALRSAADQTPRMIAAVQAPGVHILGHPRGRQYGTRPGVVADWDRVFAAAARSRVAIEVDGDPNRQDLDHALIGRAVAAGCLVALDSDAHAVEELAYAEWAIAHARLAGVPRDRVINCWPVERLLEWAASRRG